MLANLGRIIGQNARQYWQRPAVVNLERDRRFVPWLCCEKEPLCRRKS